MYIFERVLIRLDLLVFFSLLEMVLSYFLGNSIFFLFLIRNNTLNMYTGIVKTYTFTEEVS